MAAKKKTEQEIILQYKVEQSAEVKAANDAIKKSLDDVAKAAKVGGVAGAQEFKRLTNEGKKLEREMKDIRKGFDSVGSDAPDELQKIIDKAEQLNKTIRKGAGDVRDFDDEFGKSRQRVALAGDVESQARTVGGALGAVGGRGAEQAIGLGAEIPALVEALPLLKDSIKGLPDAARSAVSALGPVGLGLTAAVIGFGAAIAWVSQGLNDQVKQMKSLIEVQTDFVRDTRTMTAEQAQGVVDQARIDREIAEEQRATLVASRERAIAAKDSADIFSRGIVEAYDIFAKIPIEELDDEISELDGTISASTETIDQYSEGIANNAFQLETATQAIERQNAAIAEQNAMAIDLAKFRGDAIRTQQGLEQMSVEALEARNQAIENELTILETEKQLIIDNAEVTDDLIGTLETYNRQLALLRIEQDSINNTVIEAARAREAEAESIGLLEQAAERFVAKNIEQTAKFEAITKAQLEKRIEIEKRHADDLIAISQKAEEESAKALQRLQDKLADLSQDLGRDLEDAQRKGQRKVLEAQIEAQREQVQDFIDHNRSLQDIRREADENEIGLRQARDFRGVANARRQARIAMQKQQRTFLREQTDKNKKLQQDASDRTREFAQEREDRMRKFQQATQDARMQYATEQVLARQNAVSTVMTRRAQYNQELLDLQQQGMTAIGMRRQIAQAELGIMASVAQGANQLLSQLQSNVQGIGAFAGSLTSNITNNTNNTNANIQVSGQQQQAGAVAQNVVSILRGLVQ